MRANSVDPDEKAHHRHMLSANLSVFIFNTLEIFDIFALTILEDTKNFLYNICKKSHGFCFLKKLCDFLHILFLYKYRCVGSLVP